jgi:hypothetical protein
MIEIDSGYLRGPGIVCPTHKLEIKERKMTEIEKTEGEIKILQAKLELLKEMEKHKSPVEEAYYNVYGCYPPTTPSVSNSEDERWSAFQKGYNASKEDCKVEEPKPTLGTLYWALTNLGSYDEDNCDEIADAVEEWLPDEIYIEYGGAYERGWNDALHTIKNKLR